MATRRVNKSALLLSGLLTTVLTLAICKGQSHDQVAIREFQRISAALGYQIDTSKLRIWNGPNLGGAVEPTLVMSSKLSSELSLSCMYAPDNDVMLVTSSLDRQFRWDRGRTGEQHWASLEDGNEFMLSIGRRLSPTGSARIFASVLTRDATTGRHFEAGFLSGNIAFNFDNYCWIDRRYGVKLKFDGQSGGFRQAELKLKFPDREGQPVMNLTLSEARDRIHSRYPNLDFSKTKYYIGWAVPRDGISSKGVVSYLFLVNRLTGPQDINQGEGRTYACEATPNGRIWHY